MPTADFSTIVQSLDSLSAVERESLSSILAGKLPVPLPTGRRTTESIAPAGSKPISMGDADWDQLAGDAEIQRELLAIDREFSDTDFDGLDGA